jgi:TolB-like protein
MFIVVNAVKNLAGKRNSKMKKTMLSVVMIGLMLSIVGVVNSFAKEKIAVFPFTGIQRDANMTSLAESEMISLLVAQKRFDVVERAQLNTILKEQHLSNTGLINVEDTTEIGKIGGISYGVIGQVTNVNYSASQVYNKTTQDYDLVVDALIVLQIRIVDIKTGAILFSKTYNSKPKSSGFLGLGKSDSSGDAESTLANSLKRTYKEEISADLDKVFPIEGSIISLEDKKTVIIDIGSDSGVTKGMKFNVITREEKVSERTGKPVILTKKIGVIQVNDVTGAESSICKIKDGKNIQEGALVQLQTK